MRARRVEGAPVVAVAPGCSAGARIEETLPGQRLVTGRTPLRGESAAATGGASPRTPRARAWSSRASAPSSATASASTPWRTDWELALEWAAELLREPSFPEDRCAWTGQAGGGGAREPRRPAGRQDRLGLPRPALRAAPALPADARQRREPPRHSRPPTAPPSIAGALAARRLGRRSPA